MLVCFCFCLFGLALSVSFFFVTCLLAFLLLLWFCVCLRFYWIVCFCDFSFDSADVSLFLNLLVSLGLVVSCYVSCGLRCLIASLFRWRCLFAYMVSDRQSWCFLNFKLARFSGSLLLSFLDVRSFCLLISWCPVCFLVFRCSSLALLGGQGAS